MTQAVSRRLQSIQLMTQAAFQALIQDQLMSQVDFPGRYWSWLTHDSKCFSIFRFISTHDSNEKHLILSRLMIRLTCYDDPCLSLTHPHQTGMRIRSRSHRNWNIFTEQEPPEYTYYLEPEPDTVQAIMALPRQIRTSCLRNAIFLPEGTGSRS